MEYLTLEKKEHIATISMHRAPVNAVNHQFYREVIEMFDGIGADRDIRVAILRSDFEKYWCAGNDVNDFVGMTPENGHIRHRSVYNAYTSIYECAAPTIAAIDGCALGTGMALASVCDVIITSDRAVIGAPEINFGVMGAGKLLRRLVPEKVMREMLFSGRHVKATELERWGCLRTVPAEKLMDEVTAEAKLIASKCPPTMRLLKESLNCVESMDFKLGLFTELSYTRKASVFEDSMEAKKAFLEKREPVFKGY
ncbi:enoyl-CoA hydratase [Synergistales bacterium]|nr:enoyl-CoA hydratase [Synergistales bacterium]